MKSGKLPNASQRKMLKNNKIQDIENWLFVKTVVTDLNGNQPSKNSPKITQHIFQNKSGEIKYIKEGGT